MKKTCKKLNESERYLLKFLVENFLEFNEKGLIRHLKRKCPSNIECLLKIKSILFAGPIPSGDPDIDDMINRDLPVLDLTDSERDQIINNADIKKDIEDDVFEKLMIDSHKLLKPIWKQIRTQIFNFKDNISPHQKNTISNYGFNPFDEAQPQRLKVKKSIFVKYDLHISANGIKFSPVPNDQYQQLKNFLDFISDIPISYFSRCKFKKCGRMMVVARKKNDYCRSRHCASRKKQADNWGKNNDEMKQKEKIRYKAKRRKKRQK